MDILILKKMPRRKDASIFSDFGKLIKVTVIYSVIYCHRREYFFFYHKHFYRNKKKTKTKKTRQIFPSFILQTQDLCWDFFVE